jgi:predicted O-methyltransferase YrrM
MKPKLHDKLEIEHPLDLEYFNDYSAPIMELIHSQHYTKVNSTIAFFGPMLYFLIRALRCQTVLEVGMAQGYTSLYMASAVKDNQTRFQWHESMYYGVDIIDESDTKKSLDERGLPNTIYQMDSLELNKESFPGVEFDLIFQDGAHDAEHVIHEFDVLWPKLRSDGHGYLIMHDTMGPAEDGWREIRKRIAGMNNNINAEFCTFWEIYGMTVLRKIDNFSYSKKYWVG